MEFPIDPRGVYIVAGDPGVDGPPKRNCRRCDGGRCHGAPQKQLVYFHWVPGNGSYHPFMQSYKYAVQKYRPVMRGIDATGPQKALDELGFQDFGLVLDNLNFGALKDAMLNAFLWILLLTPGDCRGSRDSSSSSPPTAVRTTRPPKLIPQDLIMTLAQISWLARSVPAGAHT